MKLIDPRTLLKEQDKLVDRVKDAAGSDRGFSSLYEPLLQICAMYTQRLPLQDNLFRDMNGALQFCLILSRTAINTARDRIFFPREGQEERRDLEAQCAYMAFYAALASGVSLLYQNVEVFDKKDEQYHPLLNGISLYKWLESHPDAGFRWVEDNPQKKLTQMECAAIAAIMLPRGRFQFFNPKVVRMMFAAILPRSEDATTLSTMRDVISDATNAVMRHYLKKEAKEYWKSQEVQRIDDAVDIKVDKTERKVRSNGEDEPVDGAGDRRQVNPEAGEVGLDLSKLSPHTREVLKMLQKNPDLVRHEKTIKRIKEGVQVSNTIFGKFGMEASAVRKHFTADGLITKTTLSISTLVPELEPYFIPRD